METANRDLLRTCAGLARSEQADEALDLLRTALRTGELEPEDVEAAGRLVQAALKTSTAHLQVLCVRLLGQCTTSWLAPVLTAVAWKHGAAVQVLEGGYDTVIQDLAVLPGSTDVVILLPWHQRLLGDDDRSSRQRVDDELQWLHQAWTQVKEHNARLVQVGYDWVLPGALGYQTGGRGDGDVALVRATNARVNADLPDGAYLVDLEQISATIGHRSFYDARGYYWTKQPFSPTGLVCLAEHLWAGIRAVTTGPRKVLVLDLDNTLWGGVVGDVGALGIDLSEGDEGEAFAAFQRHLRALRARGVLLAVCSKNNPDDAREPFLRNPAMVLSLDDFAAFEASWDPKPAALRRIARSLRLGLDCFVFFDDQPVEREHVRQALPEVAVVDVPPDPADYLQALQDGLWFESATLTTEDRLRADQYRAELNRQKTAEAAVSVAQFLESLRLSARVEPIDETNLPRVVQLLGKTNQFNLTTRRHGEADVRRLLQKPGAFGIALRLWDRFGEYGLIALALAVPDTAEKAALRLDTWLMSCRAIGRTVEAYTMNCLAAGAKERGCRTLIGEYIPTARNQQVADLYPRLGFTAVEPTTDGVTRFRLALDDFRPRETSVRPREESVL